jgi:DNA-binding transcriptional ArsR family regulator
MMKITKFTIIRQNTLPKQNLNEQLLLLGESLGLFSLRDKDKSCYRLFIVLVKALKLKVELTSDELALQTGLSRGTVVHHLNRMMDAGIVTNYKNKYFINYASLEEMVQDLRKGINLMLDDVSIVAKNIDKSLNL